MIISNVILWIIFMMDKCCNGCIHSVDTVYAILKCSNKEVMKYHKSPIFVDCNKERINKLFMVCGINGKKWEKK